jgi:hypothetical protein
MKEIKKRGVWLSIKNCDPPTKTLIDVITKSEEYSIYNNRCTDVVYKNGKFYTLSLEFEIKGVTHFMLPDFNLKK